MIVMDENAPETLGELHRAEWRLWARCRHPQCWRGMPIGWGDLIERFGEAAPFNARTLARIVCRECRGRDIQWTVLEPYVPAGGLTHISSSEPYVARPPKVAEDPLERYRRLTAEDDYVTNPGPILGISEAPRPPIEVERSRYLMEQSFRWSRLADGYMTQAIVGAVTDLTGANSNDNEREP